MLKTGTPKSTLIKKAKKLKHDENPMEECLCKGNLDEILFSKPQSWFPAQRDLSLTQRGKSLNW